MQKASVVFMLLLVHAVASGAIVQGTVYDSGTLDVVDKAVVGINTVPAQVKVAENGTYSFFVPKGNYTITARNGQADVSEEVVVGEDGNYTRDLLLLPNMDFVPLPENPEERLVDEALGNEIAAGEGKPDAAPQAADGNSSMLQNAAIILAFGALACLLWKKRQPGAVQENKGEPKKPAQRRERGARVETVVLEPEQKEAVGIIRKAGGHLTQKELRSKMPYSEAKVSLVVTELEGMGMVKRFKRGRGNIIKLLKR